MDQELILKVKNLSITLNSENILHDISFGVKRGEALAIIDPNVCLTRKNNQDIIKLMKKWKIKSGKILFLGLFLFLPFFAFAAPAISPSCPNLSYNLYFGIHDYETAGQVSALQKFLARDASIYPEGYVTGYYGPLTEQAVKRFQSRHGLLADSRPDGSAMVGQITRAKISELCLTENLASSSTPTISDSNVFPDILSSSFINNVIKRPDVYDYGPSIINDNGVYRMYWCSPRIEGGDSIWQAKSSDGINWSDFRIVLNPTPNSEETDFESNGHVCDPSVIKISGTYYLYYTAASFSGVNNDIFLARSSDGINWNKYPSSSAPQAVIKNTVRSGGYGIGQSAVFFLNGKFYHYFTNTDKGGEMLAFSTDGINWTIQNNNQPVFSTTNFVPVYLKDYNVFFAANGHNELNHNDLYYSFSKDGINWDSKSDSRKITVGGNRGSVHNAGILTDSAGKVSGSSVLVYYGAGDSVTVMSDSFTNAASWNIDITKINFSPPPSPLSPGAIQGFKVKMPGNQNVSPPGGETVRLDNGSPTAVNPYSFTGVSAGAHTVSVSVPSGWSASYTLCYSTQTNCGAANDPSNFHGAAPISGNSVNVNVPAAGFVDLWWHYTPSANVPAPLLNFTAHPASIAKGQSFTLSWNSQNAADCFAFGGWSGTKTTNGSQLIIPSFSNTYTLTCAGADGSATQNITVKVLSSSVSIAIPSQTSPGAIQGFKVKMPGNQNVSPPGGETVRLDNGSPTAVNPYSFTGVSAGAHTVSVSVPSGWSASYTLCYSTQTNCGAANDPSNFHGAAPISGNSVNVNVPAAGFVDLWWHYTASPETPPETPLIDSYSPPKTLPAKIPLYRLHHSAISRHFYTNSENEKNNAIQNLGYTFEGIAGFLYENQQTGTTPFYRSYNPSSFDHFYTMNAAEKNAVQNLGYTFEGVTGYIYAAQQLNTEPLYRMFSYSGGHFYTMNATEKNNAVQNLGYTFEGVAGYMFTSQISAAAPGLFQTVNILSAIQRVLDEIRKILPVLK